jgi:hypothetical protein
MPPSQVDDDGSLDCGSSLLTQLFFTSSLIFSLGALPFPLFRFGRMIVSIRRSATLFSLALHLRTYRRFASSASSCSCCSPLLLPFNLGRLQLFRSSIDHRPLWQSFLCVHRNQALSGNLPTFNIYIRASARNFQPLRHSFLYIL